jgi:hypothetical protein
MLHAMVTGDPLNMDVKEAIWKNHHVLFAEKVIHLHSSAHPMQPVRTNF